MKSLFLIIVLFLISLLSFGQSRTYVKGYTKADGTYVSGYCRTNSDYTNHNNWSTTPNVNPINSRSGSRARDYSQGAYNYGSGRSINVGPRGGQYYVNSRGNKVYVPKRSR